jgi:hypothetical protein
VAEGLRNTSFSWMMFGCSKRLSMHTSRRTRLVFSALLSTSGMRFRATCRDSSCYWPLQRLPMDTPKRPYLLLGGVIYCQAHAREAAEAQHAHQRVARANLRGHKILCDGTGHDAADSPNVPPRTFHV